MQKIIMLIGLLCGGLGASAMLWAMGDRPADDGRGNRSSISQHSKPAAIADIPFLGHNRQLWYLSHFRGQVVMLNFWATWCPPCVKEMPAFDRLQARYGAQGLRIIPISQDRPTPEKTVDVAVSQFYQQFGLRHLGVFYSHSAQAYSLLNIPGLPTTLLVDKQGRERARIRGMIDWESPAFTRQIEALLAE